MNNYPVWWDQSLTIYNRYEDPTTQLVTWYRHTVSNCFWKYVHNITMQEGTSLETANVICRIPKDDRFKERQDWVKLTNDVKANYFTLGVGDIIVRGTVTDTINEYLKQHRSTDLLAKYRELQGSMQIEIVAINVGPGRCNEHYYVSDKAIQRYG